MWWKERTKELYGPKDCSIDENLCDIPEEKSSFLLRKFFNTKKTLVIEKLKIANLLNRECVISQTFKNLYSMLLGRQCYR